MDRFVWESDLPIGAGCEKRSVDRSSSEADRKQGQGADKDPAAAYREEGRELKSLGMFAAE